MLDILEPALALCVWEGEGGRAASLRSVRVPAAEYRASRRGVPRFMNDIGSAMVEIGVRAFNCIGATPPADHPHVYLDMGEHPSILCPYCATLFQFDAALRGEATRPPGCSHGDAAPLPDQERYP
jgi:uncharacterized Zn-finger protein